MSILPPGENGLVNAADAAKFETTRQRPANSQDQLGKYANLLYGYPSLTDSTLNKYYHDESFGVRSGDITRTEAPESGVTIYRDRTTSRTSTATPTRRWPSAPVTRRPRTGCS